MAPKSALSDSSRAGLEDGCNLDLAHSETLILKPRESRGAGRTMLLLPKRKKAA
jgi:hypothetical protein